MEKKAEKQTEFILTPEEGGSETRIELVAGEEETVTEQAAAQTPIISPNNSAKTDG